MSASRAVHQELGLTDSELAQIEEILGREPTYTELAMFSVMWSEHCSYKSSRVHLRRLPTSGESVLVGPGEGAGVIGIAPGVSVAWKIESHNHPSFVEPASGAATGVGGIVRDILSMGARPVALLDSLRFGPVDEARNAYLVEGVVHGISSYGNSIGVPTVGGEALFEDCYSENPLVNVACLGVIETKLMHGRAERPGDLAILIGSATGRDGIGGASVLASAEFDETSASKRPSVQVGDPFTEKLLIEATLELIARGLVVACQDLGAGGISCPTSEMTSKGGTGIVVDIDNVHRREPGMEPFEVMISESQERMLLIVRPEDVDAVAEVTSRWGLDARQIGRLDDSGRLRASANGEIEADVPVDALAEAAPIYERPMARPGWLDRLNAEEPGADAPADLKEAFLAVLGSPGICSKRWIWEQYDHMIFLGTVRPPGGDAAVIRLRGGPVGVAVSVDGPARYCYLDPYEGARLAVAEAARNVACVGAKPVAVTNCLNFGSPEKPEVMWQFAEAVRGISDACRELDTPVVGGNVSFYNETNGRPIYPTPVIGMLGALPDVSLALGHRFQSAEDEIVLLGTTDPADFGGSEFAKIVNKTIAGRPPHLDLAAEIALQRMLERAATTSLLRSAHDISSGGLAITLAESALAGNIGFTVDVGDDPEHAFLFAETPARAIVSCAPGDTTVVLALAEEFSVAARVIGTVGGDQLSFGSVAVSLSDAQNVYEQTLPASLSATMD
ncbi:MAG TPA: phosphoribosylformylglycinamidine synthase subunit PurL [Actinomycetota bacterium]|nr:phosphoribosylformylglycinamidine synthase subunit PurL [Actinomycetota bacterium]